MFWSRDAVLELIEIYRQNPILYNPKHRLYKNKQARLEALESMTAIFKEQHPKITLYDIKSKCQALRGQYTSELKKIKCENKSGMSGDERTEPYWFSKLSFLKEYVGHKDTCNNFQTQNEEDLTFEETFIDFPNDRKRNFIDEDTKSGLESKHNEEINKNVVTSIELINRIGNKLQYNNEVDTFGEYVKAQLMTISDANLQADLRHMILDMIYRFKQDNNAILNTDTNDNGYSIVIKNSGENEMPMKKRKS